MGEKVLEGGEGNRKSAFLFSLCQNTAVLLHLFRSLALSKLFLASEKKVFTLWPGSLESRSVPAEQIYRSLSKMVSIFSL